MSLSQLPIGVRNEETGNIEFRSIGHQVNTSDAAVSFTATCAVEVHKNKQLTNSASRSNRLELNGSIGAKELVDAHATFTGSHTQTTERSNLVSNGETCSTKTEIKVTLQPGMKLYLWQPVALFGEWGSLTLNNVFYTNTPTPPANDIVCTAVFREPIKIMEGHTKFRRKHQERGTYVNTFKPFFWEAATLGESREYFFTFSRVENSKYVRIELCDPIFKDCACAYPTNHGGVYFDKRDDKDDRQLWEMSNSYPVDGDVVTFRNKKWPTSGLGYYDGPDTNVYRVKGHDLDKWILEVVE